MLINTADVGRPGGGMLRSHLDTSFPLVMTDASVSNVLFVVHTVNGRKSLQIHVGMFSMGRLDGLRWGQDISPVALPSPSGTASGAPP